MGQLHAVNHTIFLLVKPTSTQANHKRLLISCNFELWTSVRRFLWLALDLPTIVFDFLGSITQYMNLNAQRSQHSCVSVIQQF